MKKLVCLDENVPSYAKFLKGALSNKTSMEKLVCLDENCSAVFQNKIPPKRQDPGSFTIPCTIGPMKFDSALCDLGASVNLMSLKTYKQLGLGNLTSTSMALQMADRTVRYPQGIAEDILVQVDRFAFPADFVVLEMDESARTPLLLGRPFLATGGAKMDIKTGEITLGVDDDTVTYNVYDDIKKPYDIMGDCLSIDLVDTCVLEVTNMQVREDKMEECLVKSSTNEDSDVELQEEANSLERTPFRPPRWHKFLELELSGVKLKPSIDDPPRNLELKPLPSHLKYVFLQDDLLPLIISSTLTILQEEKLVSVLKKHKKAFGWTIADIKGISPEICTHKIILEEDAKPIAQGQRRLNPKMQEVVKKEVVKMLEMGIIYAISDSEWIRHDQKHEERQAQMRAKMTGLKKKITNLILKI